MAKMNFVLNDLYVDWMNLNPLTLTKSISKLRIGITTLEEKWAFYLKDKIQIKPCAVHLQALNTFKQEKDQTYIFINSSFIPNEDIVSAILNLKDGDSIYYKGISVASRTTFGTKSLENDIHYDKELLKISYPWDIFKLNAQVVEQDFNNLTQGRKSAPLSKNNTIIGDESQIFLEEGAKVEAAILNTKTGPIYLGKNAEIMEGSVIRGALALCEGASLKLATKIYGATTVGPHSKVGGEVNNSVIQGYSNKGHDGFLGNSVIGEWCNLGADTNNSNLKNNYGIVKVYNFQQKDYIDSGLQFLGLIMGDHSKCGINTMFNTGTVVGVFANIFGGGFPPKFIPSFAWGGADGFNKFKLEKAFEVAEKVMARRNVQLSETDKDVLTHLFNESEII